MKLKLNVALMMSVYFTVSSSAAAQSTKLNLLALHADHPDVQARLLTDEEIANALATPAPKLTQNELDWMPEKRHRHRRKSDQEGEIILMPPGPPDTGPPTRYTNPASIRPLWNVGKLAYQNDVGTTYYCTAQFVASTRVLMTAAHCVYDASKPFDPKNPMKNFYKNFTFQQASAAGAGSKNIGYKCVSIDSDYFNSGIKDHAYDVAFLYMKEISAAGWLGFGIKFDNKTVAAVGYPANYSNGQYLYEAIGTETVEIPVGTIVSMSNNPMRGGASGGAWILNININTGPTNNIAIGLNSFSVDSKTTTVYGPYFDYITNELLNTTMKGSCRIQN